MIRFVKGHGLGNDYVVIDQTELAAPVTRTMIRRLCDRHRGIGSDGILLRVPASRADFGLRIFNPDGSEAEKSGNGLRIFAKYLWDHRHAKTATFTVETKGGVVECQCHVQAGRVNFVTVEMGRATFRAPEIPMSGPDREVVGVPLQLSDGTTLSVTAVSVGNPHCVTFVNRLDDAECRRLGPLIENHPAFPNRTNVQFARPHARSEEHTSDSSHANISYAVFCLKKKRPSTAAGGPLQARLINLSRFLLPSSFSGHELVSARIGARWRWA